MKKLLFSILLSISLLSCYGPGETRNILLGTEKELPEQLKGLEIYNVGTQGGGVVSVAVLNDNVNSLTYQQGKTRHTTIIIDKNNNSRIINAVEVLSETDDIIVLRKK